MQNRHTGGGGTLITLTAVTVFPIVFRILGQTPAGYSGPATAAAWTAIATFVVTVAVSLMFLVERGLGTEKIAASEITVRARPSSESLERELVAAPADANLQAMIGQLHDAPADSIEDTRLRILSRMVSELTHQQFKDSDYLLIRLDSDRERYRPKD